MAAVDPNPSWYPCGNYVLSDEQLSGASREIIYNINREEHDFAGFNLAGVELFRILCGGIEKPVSAGELEEKIAALDKKITKVTLFQDSNQLGHADLVAESFFVAKCCCGKQVLKILLDYHEKCRCPLVDKSEIVFTDGTRKWARYEHGRKLIEDFGFIKHTLYWKNADIDPSWEMRVIIEAIPREDPEEWIAWRSHKRLVHGECRVSEKDKRSSAIFGESWRLVWGEGWQAVAKP